MINFLHTYLPDPVFVSIGLIQIYWYSMLIVVSVMLAFFITYKLGRHYKIKLEEIIDIGFYIIIFGIIGARLYHVLLEFQFYFARPLEIFKIWKGGLAIHGAVIAGIIVILIYAKKKKQSFWLWTDLIAPVLILGQAIGRWGNYFNQELFGMPTSLPWGIPIEFSNRVEQYLADEFFHPVFLYESVLNMAAFVSLMIMHKVKIAKKIKDGNIFLAYLVLYSTIRFFMEFLRTDPTLVFLGLRLPQIVSLLIIFIAILIMLLERKKPGLQ